MKHGKKPTREQRKLLEKWKLDTTVWLVVKDMPDRLELVHRFSDKTTKTIHKEKKEW
jgi:hypothetical protein